MNKDVKKLNNLRNSLKNFEKSYNDLVDNSVKIDNVNELGTIPEYPFSDSLDNIDVSKWIEKFVINIDRESLKILRKKGELLNKKEASKYLKMSAITFDRSVKKYLACYDSKAIYIDNPENSNGKKNFYTRDFCDYIRSQKINDKVKK